VSVVSAGVARNSAQVGERLEAENQMSGTIVEGIVVSNKKIRILTK
jgi:flagella basal body P-ring formation protein FlgA